MVMITFKQFLQQNQNEYLYHGTTLENVYKILQTDRMIGQPYNHSDVRVSQSAIFFSRSHARATWFTQWFKYAKHPIVLVIDRKKLAQNYSIQPVQNNLRRSPEYDRSPARAGARGTLAEEYVLGDIKDIHRYLVRIDVFYQETWNMINKDKTKFPKLKNHSALLHFEPDWVK